MPIDPHSFHGHAPRDRDYECPHCGYNLRGLSADSNCPECGLHPSQSDDGQDDGQENGDDVPATLPPHVYQGRVLVDHSDPSPGSPGIRGSIRRPTCTGCGYDLSSLPSVGRCPECGRAHGAERPHRPVEHAVQLMPDAVILSPAWQLGTGMLLGSAGAFMVFSLYSLYTGRVPSGVYAAGMILITSLWAFGTWLALPRSLDGGSSTWCGVRLAACGTQLLWPASMLFAWGMSSDFLSGGAGLLLFFSRACDLFAFTGLVIILVELERMTRDMALRISSKRLVAALWIILPAGFLALVLPVPTVAEPGFVTAGAFPVIVLSILLTPMYTIAAIVTLALLDLFKFGQWATRYDRSLADRPGRVAAKQAALSGASDWMPEGEGEVTVERSCGECGYDLRGHGPSAACPECGWHEGSSSPPHPGPVIMEHREPAADPDDIPLD